MTDDPFAAALADLRAALPGPPARPRHPATGCPCSSCVERDDRLESLAEERALARRGY